MLKNLQGDLLKIVQDIIKQKKSDKSVIGVEDLKGLIGLGSASSAIDTTPAQQESEILMDSSPAVNTAEGVEGYSMLFKSRFEKTMRILAQRPDSRRIASISAVRQGTRAANVKNERDARSSPTYVISGLLMSRRQRKNGIELEIDDRTGRMPFVAVTEDTRKAASMLALDQVVMLEVETARGVPGLSVKSIFSPDIPDHLANRSRSETYAVLISDLHVGSRYFMEQEFLAFLNWLSSDDEVARKINFICIGGDLIDGIGIFPNQDRELVMTDVETQMSYVTRLLSKIPNRIKTFIIPGNHDPGRRALPQPAFPQSMSGGLYSLENCTVLGNPAHISLNGVKVLMFHGQSLDDVIATTPGLSYQRPAEAMKVLLRARHLSPTYGGRTPIAPEIEDMMVMTDVPDILHCGHVHVTDVDGYRGTLIVNSGAWQGQTKFQQTMGIRPSPGIAVVVNLATMQPFLKDFTSDQ